MRIKPGQRPQRAREPRSSRGQSLGARRVLEANAARHDFKHAVAFKLGEGTADRFDGQPQEVRYALLSRWCSSHVDLPQKQKTPPTARHWRKPMAIPRGRVRFKPDGATNVLGISSGTVRK